MKCNSVAVTLLTVLTLLSLLPLQLSSLSRCSFTFLTLFEFFTLFVLLTLNTLFFLRTSPHVSDAARALHASNALLSTHILWPKVDPKKRFTQKHLSSDCSDILWSNK